MLRFILSICMLFVAGLALTQSQTEKQGMQSLESWELSLDEAIDSMGAFKNDPAIIILDSLENLLKLEEKLDEPFGLRVQDKLAEALEMDHKNELAIEKLLHVSEVSLEKENWEVFANSNVSLARLFEKIDREEACLKHLNIARSAISKYNLETIYPRFMIRMASYHRLFTNQDSALYFVNEAIRTSPMQGKIELKGTGHLLKGILLFKKDPNKSLEQFEAAIKIWNEAEDHAGLSFAHYNMSRIYLDQKRYDLALFRNDSTLLAASVAEEKGHDYLPIFTSAYNFRSKLYEELGKLDSALHYSQLAHQTEIEV